MKKIILMIIGVMLAAAGMQAQNANRKGIFIELQGGGAFGTVINCETENNNIKSGFVGAFDIGYRYPTSKSFAVEGKIDLWADFLEFERTLNFDIMPGIRWTSNDFSSNKSMYLSLNAGFGFGSRNRESMFVPIELGLGFNLTNNLYLGFFLTDKVCISTAYYHKYLDEGLTSFRTTSYTSAGIKLGYRF